MGNGRSLRPERWALLETAQDGRLTLRAPAVGLWRGAPLLGAVITGGTVVGQLEVLGVLHDLRVPEGARGQVVERFDDDRARIPVAHGDALLVLDPEAAGEVMVESAAVAAGEAGQGLFFRAPSSGRFYVRPSPDKPSFVTEGQEVEAGDVVCLLEVMKTFNRVGYAPDAATGLPERVRVLRVVPTDGADLDAGDPILELEPA
jgi:acetyl-CoA carboxylase biotin carboxyl carrier protein